MTARQLDDILAAGYELDFEDTFDGTELDRSRWVPVYLPHWAAPGVSAARYVIAGGSLQLLIEEGQEPWCPEFDGPTRVSSIQTGAFSGPVGSQLGQHRFHPEATVRSAHDNTWLYTPTFGVISLRAKAVADPDCMVSLWMIGYEDRPERSGEICVCEIFGRDVAADTVAVGMGIHPFGDPALVDDFEAVALAMDATAFHEYAAEWTPQHVRFFVDGRLMRQTRRAPHYPMQLMLGIYEFGDHPAGSYPKTFTVDWVRGYRPR